VRAKHHAKIIATLAVGAKNQTAKQQGPSDGAGSQRIALTTDTQAGPRDRGQRSFPGSPVCGLTCERQATDLSFYWNI